MKKLLLVSVAVGAVGAVVAMAVRQREAITESPAARSAAAKVKSGATKIHGASHDVSSRVQSGVLGAADAVGSATDSVSEKADRAAVGVSSAAQSAEGAVAEASERVAAAADEKASSSPTASGPPA